MNRFAAIALALFLAIPSLALAEPIKATGTVEVFFSPNGGAEAAIIREVDRAKTEILIQAYTFTDKRLAGAITAAKRRGVHVEAILDKGNAAGKYSVATYLKNAGVPVLIDNSVPLAHSKNIIIDRQTVITGSYNYTRQAERNTESLLVLKGNPALTESYTGNYARRKALSEPF